MLKYSELSYSPNLHISCKSDLHLEYLELKSHNLHITRESDLYLEYLELS